ncbi:hypothetical protein C8R41DRAFT_496802 [Lentinula lateritia]|uniref:Uncharacterized protein n=1 Tax=Lentinula lateritia TaxID=40482 RepID=A0ABQ8VC37_9AGAR|nr:hypothetical protein C8R41DRAFT_496802 [Lentinula lateritia]
MPSYFPSTPITSLRLCKIPQTSASSAIPRLLSRIKHLASRCSLSKLRPRSRSMATTTVPNRSSYRTTVPSSQAMVTFTSFGIYNFEAGPSEIIGTNDPTNREATHACPNKSQTSQSTVTSPHIQDTQDSEQYRSNPPAPASQLAKKILARPPSLNGPPGPPIPMKFVVLPPIATEADAEDTSDESVSDAAVSTRTASLSSSTCHTSGDDNSEMDEPTLRPLTVPPWHMKSRRPNVCATAATSLQPHPLYTALDGPMRFPF